MSIPDHFDLIVIGSGPAGEKGAAQAAYFGKRVCLIERAPKPAAPRSTPAPSQQDAPRDGTLLLGTAPAGSLWRRPERQAEHHHRRLHAPRARGHRDRLVDHRREHRQAWHHDGPGRGAIRRPTHDRGLALRTAHASITGDRHPRRHRIDASGSRWLCDRRRGRARQRLTAHTPAHSRRRSSSLAAASSAASTRASSPLSASASR